MKEPRLIELTALKPGYLASINNLLSQLSDSVHTIDEEELNTLLSSSQSHLYVLESDGQFIGMTTLCLYQCPKKAFALSGRHCRLYVNPGCYPGLGASALSGRVNKKTHASFRECG